ncbi:cytochrome c1 [Afifella sp. IM 167]|uniref:cytochrome c1 n=1 Tax=Afifella sp. IM 167 TaxID=2033586 RepID=UPI001CCA6470|nr:cytochrome c1 [Afifella sp. IM 167]MBZ8134871.1 cytochrome c1 [Afifella sp. IM 167]
MLKLITQLSAAGALVLASFAMASAAEEALPHFPLKEPEEVDWSFSGPFGTYDQQQLQRGFQVYREICSACHSLNLVPFRALGWEGGPHFSEEEVKALAAEYTVTDGPDDTGEMFERPGAPYDYFPAPFPNAKAAAYANGGAAPPDLSVIAQGRGVERGFPTFITDIFTTYQEGGPDYIHALLTGYEDPPEGEDVRPGQYYNPHYAYAAALAMPPPLFDDAITYAQNEDEDPNNDVPQTVDQYSKDVAAFLMWAAEPHMEARKSMGFTVLAFLLILTALTYYTKRRVWSDVEH